MAPDEQPAGDDGAAEQAPAPAKPAKTRPVRGKATAYLEVLLNVIVLGSVCFIGYMVYEQDKAVGVLFDQQNRLSADRNTALDEANTALDGANNALDRIEAQQATIERLQSELMNTRGEISGLQQEQNARLDDLRKELVSMRLGISNRYSAASQEWLLAESASLLRLAQQHLIVSHDVRTAQALYLAADDILKQIDDPAIFSIREILAEELAEIRAVPEVDAAAIYLELGAVSDQVSRLSVSNDLDTRIAQGRRVDLVDTAEDAGGWWSRFLGNIKDTLDNYLVVRRRDAPLQAMMTPDQEAAIMQGISLEIEQARTALLKGQQEIYTSSLARARDSVSSYLGGDDAVRNAVLTSLDRLREKRIVSAPPPLNRARVALEDLLATRDDQPADDAAGAQ